MSSFWSGSAAQDNREEPSSWPVHFRNASGCQIGLVLRPELSDHLGLGTSPSGVMFSVCNLFVMESDFASVFSGESLRWNLRRGNACRRLSCPEHFGDCSVER